MTSFVHTNFRSNHPGVDRMESAFDAARQMRKGFDGTRGLAAMLLAAVVAALLVVADQLVTTWADGDLMAAWVTLWAIGFAALALFANSARTLAGRAISAADAWSQRVAQNRADERMWSIAQKDTRVMADLQAAMTRSESGVAVPAAGMTASASEMPFALKAQPQGRSFYGYY